MTAQHRFADSLGLPLSTSSASAVEHYLRAMEQLQAYDVGTAEEFEAAIAADEGFALAHAALGYTCFLQAQPDAAKAHLTKAEGLAAGTTHRERQHVAVLSAMIAGDSPRGLRLADEHLAEFSRDALVLSAWYFMTARSGTLDRHELMFARFAALAPAYGDEPFFLASFSFLHHELDLFDEARRLAERSLTLYPRGASAAHSLAHVFYETDGHADGAGWLGGWIDEYSRQAPLFCHLSWHRALFALASGHYTETLALYERDISPAAGTQLTTLVDASSLLWRHEVYGCPTGPLPWPAVRELAGKMAVKPGLAFLDAHVALALAADDGAFAALIDGLRALEAKGHPTAGSVVLPLALGVGAFAHGDYAEAIRRLEPTADQVVRIGGSNAQRAVFEDTLIEAYLRAEQFDRAETLLRKRLDRRTSARDFFWLGRAQAGSNQASAAEASLAQAEDRWAGADADGPELNAVAALRSRLTSAV